MPVAEKNRIMPPMKITGLLQAKWANQVLKTALELDVFSNISQAGASAGDVATKIKTQVRPTELLLDALTSMEILEKRGGIYKLTEMAQHYLVPSSELYFGGWVLGRDNMEDAWEKLTDAVRHGQSQKQVNIEETAQKFFPDLAAAIFPINFSTAQMVADHLNVKERKGETRVLDLAAGSAVWSIPFAQSNKNVKVDALDFGPVLNVTKKFATKFGVVDKYNYLTGNWRDVSLKDETYDFILLGHILHSEGKTESEKLLKACYKALKSGGTLMIAEFIINDERSGPPFAAMFAINMFLMTTEGCVFGMDELKKMCRTAGFAEVERLPLPYWREESPVVIAKKK